MSFSALVCISVYSIHF